jgi:REP element-mobilizing transposase RayT
MGGSTYFITFRLQSGSLSPAERRHVIEACLFWHKRRAIVHLVTVMPDHVHLLLTPLKQADGTWPSLAKLLHSIKSYSSKQIQSERGGRGQLWQSEYFDRLMRDENEFREKWNYMLANPIKAGLADRPWDYEFTVSTEEAWKVALADDASGLMVIGGDKKEERGREGGEGGRHGQDARATRKKKTTQVLAIVRGTFEGRIGLPGDVPRGGSGFGYDPLFLVAPEYTHTCAELSSQQKNARSHRGNAARLMAQRIAHLLETHEI